MKVPAGFTLIELLVVMAIMAVVGTFALANFASFGESRKLDNAVLDIQSQLRTAQANATSNVQCDQFSSTWQVEFKADAVTTNLNCQNPISSPAPSPVPTPTTKKTLQLNSNGLISISQVLTRAGTNCPSGLPFIVYFAPLTGKMTIGNDSRCQVLTIILQNTKTNPVSTKTLNIDQGGRFYAE